MKSDLLEDSKQKVWLDNLAYWGAKAIVVAAFSVFLARIIPRILQAPTITLVLLMAGEVLLVVLVIFAKRPTEVKFGFIACTSAVVATFYFFVVVLDSGQQLMPVWFSASLQVFGILIQIWAKVCLGRSFGLLPANRGIVTHGAYRIVRHPIYLGYLISHIGFLVASYSFANLALYVGLYVFQGIRIWQEENLLCKDSTYAAYKKRTRYRLIPLVI
ncbi:isoprenylcysteine carboxylmethyltransferase family protein [Variovorax sp. dw_954]|uniref:methyltransferase family protein n=1 Tax=Variovorax sp. dw_954 TaxID=2720078 RepID=UPI001BD47B70|nr:isoprenylcysteine carboxylmethyltransferase family protein [Variovorax sp. dw_954]